MSSDSILEFLLWGAMIIISLIFLFRIDNVAEKSGDGVVLIILMLVLIWVSVLTYGALIFGKVRRIQNG